MTHDMPNFVSSLVEMAKAMEELPKVRDELFEAHSTINAQLGTIQRLELKLIDRSSEIERLQASLRSEEAKRSDAETMFLECDDAKSTLVRTLESLGKDIASVLEAVKPLPKPEPVVELKPEPPVEIVPRDTFQGVKSNPVGEYDKATDAYWDNGSIVGLPLQDGPLSPFVPSPDTTPSTDASSNADGEGSVSVDPTPHVTDAEFPTYVNSSDGAATTTDGVSVSVDPIPATGHTIPSAPVSDGPAPLPEHAFTEPKASNYYDYDGVSRASHHS
jgi:hypothetical protein